MNNNCEPTEQEIEQSNNDAEVYDAYLRERMGEFESYEQWGNKTPLIIFKFRSVSDSLSLVRTIDIFRKHRLFMSSPTMFNDPFEGGNVDYLDSDREDEYYNRVKRCKILSLSKNCFSAPLWAHYASECSGICIGFNTYKSFASIKEIEYTDTVNKKQWWSIDMNDAINREFIYKNSDWSYEDEYRIVDWSNADAKEPMYHEFDESEMVMVIFGERIEKEIRDELIQIIPPTCLAFDIKVDKSHSRYYLVKCDTSENPIYGLEELYKIVLSYNINGLRD